MVLRAAFLLFLLGILGPGLPAVAQGAAPYAKADTLRAVRAFFTERRSSGQSLALAGGTTMVLGVGVGVIGASADGLGAAPVVSALGSAAVGLTLLLVGKSRQKEVTPAREAAVVGGYEQGQALPREISRRLKRWHFAEPRPGK